MPEGSSILAFLGSIKTAKETLTLILDAPKVLEKAELELRIASLTKTLTELENQARNFENIIQGKDKEIEGLKTLLKQKNVSQTNNLREECIEILKLLIESPATSNTISEDLHISEERARYFLEILSEKQLVDFSTEFDPSPWDFGRIPYYALNPNSRKYLEAISKIGGDVWSSNFSWL